MSNSSISILNNSLYRKSYFPTFIKSFFSSILVFSVSIYYVYYNIYPFIAQSLLNIGQNTYADYELGKTRIPVDSLIKLAQFYDVDMNYITNISKTVHKFPKEKQQLAAVNKRKKIVIPEHTLHCCQFYLIQLSKLNSLDPKFLAYGSKSSYSIGSCPVCPSGALDMNTIFKVTFKA